jgi:hypothetical protein
MSRTAILPTLLATVALAACGAAPDAGPTAAERLYVWTGDADEADPDFLAVFDVRPGSPRYGQVVTTVPVEGRSNWPHHTEYEATAGRTLLANGWNSGKTFVFDLSDPDQPRVRSVLGEAGGYGRPHSYARLPNGNVLATFQSKAGEYMPPGGLVELDGEGRVVRAVSGSAPGIPVEDTWPYSLLVLPDLDRVVTTNTRMGTVAEWLDRAPAPGEGHAHVGRDSRASHIQVWRLSDLALVATLQLPPQAGGHHEYPAEPRRLASGEVLVNTFSCGLYRLTGLDADRPAVAPVLASALEGTQWCAVPVVVGNYWIQPSATERAVIAYDLSDPSTPREASRVALDERFRGPHWLARDAGASRVVVTAEDPDVWVMLLDVDPATGRLTIDEAFRDRGADRPGVSFDRAQWPHGRTGRGVPHGAVFGAPRSR